MSAASFRPVAMPKWGLEMTEGTLTEWRVGVGDKVAKGDELAEIESDKIVNVLEASADGYLCRQIASVDETLSVGNLLGVIASQPSADDTAIDAFIQSWQPPAAGPEESEKEPAAKSASNRPSSAGSKTRVSPVVRRLAEKLGVDLETVTGSGRNGRITTDDIEAAASGSTQANSPSENSSTPDSVDQQTTSTPLSATRKTIARKLTESKQQLPHYYLTTDINIDPLLIHRATLNESGATKVSVNDLMISCVAKTLIEEPSVNAHFLNDEIVSHSSAHIALAVATEAGLVTPVIRNAQAKSVTDIAAESQTLATKARSGGLTNADVTGGTFTVSNLGMFGIREFTAIINPPQVAILAIGSGEARVIAEAGQPSIANMLTVTLSCDHRVIDGAVGARFLASLRNAIQTLSSP